MMHDLSQPQDEAPHSVLPHTGVWVTFASLEENGPSSMVHLPARAVPYTVGEALLCADFDPTTFEAIGSGAFTFLTMTDLSVLSASDLIQSNCGICLERRVIAPDLSDVLGCNTINTVYPKKPKQPAHGQIEGANTIRTSVKVSGPWKRRFFR